MIPLDDVVSMARYLLSVTVPLLLLGGGLRFLRQVAA